MLIRTMEPANDDTDKVFARFLEAMKISMEEADVGNSGLNRCDVIMIMANLMGQAIADDAQMSSDVREVATTILMNINHGYHQTVARNAAAMDEKANTETPGVIQ